MRLLIALCQAKIALIAPHGTRFARKHCSVGTRIEPFPTHLACKRCCIIGTYCARSLCRSRLTLRVTTATSSARIAHARCAILDTPCAQTLLPHRCLLNLPIVPFQAHLAHAHRHALATHRVLRPSSHTQLNANTPISLRPAACASALCPPRRRCSLAVRCRACPLPRA